MQQELISELPTNEYYLHEKSGGYYILLFLGQFEKDFPDGEIQCFYRSLSDGMQWIRPLESEFKEKFVLQNKAEVESQGLKYQRQPHTGFHCLNKSNSCDMRFVMEIGKLEKDGENGEEYCIYESMDDEKEYFGKILICPKKDIDDNFEEY